MANILHRLAVRKLLVNALAQQGLAGVKVISREAGCIDLIQPMQQGKDATKLGSKVAKWVQQTLAASGVEFTLLSISVNTDSQLVVSFTNSLMSFQAGYGARGNSKSSREAKGIPTFPMLAVEATEEATEEAPSEPQEATEEASQQ